MAEMLRLGNCLVECCNIRTAFKLVKNRRKQLFSFAFLFLLGNVDFVLFNFPLFQGGKEALTYVYLAITSIVFFLFMLTWQTDPGLLRKNGRRVDILSLLDKYDPSQICPDCKIYKPPRSRHCEIC